MTSLNASMRLKANRDTFFIPDSEGGVYFRNNIHSFRMEGEMIDRWIEKLMPMFSGEHTLEWLTDGLPDPHRNRVYEIAEVLCRNGFVRDVSQDAPHRLPEEILRKFASQIEFLDHFGGSGAYRFQSYRQTKVLAVGAGPFLHSLASALLDSGLPKFHALAADSALSGGKRLAELAAHARKTDAAAAIEQMVAGSEGVRWSEAVQPFDVVLYVSRTGDLEELRALQAVCRAEKKLFIPAVCLQQAGMAGPLVHPDDEGCWESAWRRLHRTVISKDPAIHAISSTAEAMLANAIVFECFKKLTGVTDSERNGQLFLLDLETLEGKWHSFMPHPLVTGRAAAKWMHDPEGQLDRKSTNSSGNGIFACLSRLTSEVTGILHVWGEGDLQQLPLAQCRVQAVDPLSQGPAELLPDIVCTDLSHEGARREAALAGIEAYASGMAGLLASKLPPEHGAKAGKTDPQAYIGVGAGETVEEAVLRGLQKCLNEELGIRLGAVVPVLLTSVEDKRCAYYLQALTTMQAAPKIGLGAEVSGFPSFWVGTGDRWHGGVGLNATIALRNALQLALLQAQNQGKERAAQPVEAAAVRLAEKEPVRLKIPADETEAEAQSGMLQSAVQVLGQKRKRLLVFELELEPIFKEELAGVFGVQLREEGGR